MESDIQARYQTFIEVSAKQKRMHNRLGSLEEEVDALATVVDVLATKVDGLAHELGMVLDVVRGRS
jgi:hypothetical protein